MSEYPTPKPTTPINWSDSGTRTEPGVAKRDAGWAFGEKPPHDFFNAIQGNFGDHIAYTEGTALRGFEAVEEGIDATTPGEMFRVINALPRTPHEGDITHAFPGGDSGYLVCSDGRYVYVASIVDNELRRYDFADKTAAPVEVWSVALNLNTPERMKTDGAVIIIGGLDAGDDMRVFNAADGALLHSKAIASAPVVAVEADSDFEAFTDPRVFWSEAATIYEWRSVGGESLWSFTSGDVLAMCSTPDKVITVENALPAGLNGIAVVSYDKATKIALPLAIFPEHPKDSPAAICSDGDSVWVALYYQGVATAPTLTRLAVAGATNPHGYNYRRGEPHWSTTLLEAASVATNAFARIEVDDRYVYVKGANFELYILEKETGSLVYIKASDVLSFAIDGTWVYQTSSGTPINLNTLGTTRQVGLWLRAGDGASTAEDGLFGSRRKPFKKLALPVR